MITTLSILISVTAVAVVFAPTIWDEIKRRRRPRMGYLIRVKGCDAAVHNMLIDLAGDRSAIRMVCPMSSNITDPPIRCLSCDQTSMPPIENGNGQ